MVGMIYLPNVIHLSLDRPFASSARCSQIFTNPPEEESAKVKVSIDAAES
jgi:hypothetical protein